MPFQSPFNFPYFFKSNYKYNYYMPQNTKQSTNTHLKNQEKIDSIPTKTKSEDSVTEHKTRSIESSEYLFEIFGLKLYFDDVLILCLLYFLYTEEVKDQELFLCLILLLLSWPINW